MTTSTDLYPGTFLFSLILPIMEKEKTVFSTKSSLRVNKQCDTGVFCSTRFLFEAAQC